MRILLVLVALSMIGCSTLPRGTSSPKTPSFALERPQDTRLGRKFLAASQQHQDESGYHIINSGIDGLVTRIQMIDAAERTVDMQYFIFRGDDTGLLIAEALEHAADRGVRVRILVDDGDTVAGDQKILALDRHPNIEVRIFNPFDYRGHNAFLRQVDFALHKGRLDYRMHNKLMVVDNSVALVGGRNIGAQYFQVEPDSQFADDDAFAAGEIGASLSKTFDSYWNSEFSVPSALLPIPKERSKEAAVSFKDGGVDVRARIASGSPFRELVTDDGALHWAKATVVCDSPDKKDVELRKKRGRSHGARGHACDAGSPPRALDGHPIFRPFRHRNRPARGAQSAQCQGQNSEQFTRIGPRALRAIRIQQVSPPVARERSATVRGAGSVEQHPRERPEPRNFTLWNIRFARQALCDGPAALLHRIHEL